MPSLIARVCGCLYYAPIIWDKDCCNKDTKLDETQTIATSQVHTSGYRNAFIVGDYDYNTNQVFKFKIIQHGTIYFGTVNAEYGTNMTTTQVGGHKDMYSLASWSGAISRNDYYSKLIEIGRLENGDIVAIVLNNGYISYYVNDKLIGSEYELSKEVTFKIGVSMDYKGDSVQIIDSFSTPTL